MSERKNAERQKAASNLEIKVSAKAAAAAARIEQAVKGFDQLPDAAYVPPAVAQALTNRSRATILRMVRDGRLPAPRKLSARAVGFNVGELRHALAALSA